MSSEQYDLVVVGAGATGLLAAVAARRLGRSVLVIEASDLVGGSTATLDGRMWLPGNHLSAKGGTPDTLEAGSEYLDALLGETTIASTAERRAAFVEDAPRLARWLTSSRISLSPVRHLADHHRKLPGAVTQGRVVQPGGVDRRILGEWRERLRGASDAPDSALARLLPGHQTTRTSGESLTAQLLSRAVGIGVHIWLRAPVTELLTDQGRVSGVLARRDGHPVEVDARMVLLASGGFERDQALREEHLPLPTSAEWSLGVETNTGQALRMATALGAATADLDSAWWQPVLLSEGHPHPVWGARKRPHSLIVDSIGDRFVNECSSGYATGQACYGRVYGVQAVPCFLVMDKRHRQQVPLGPWPAGNTPRRAIEEGEIVKANTLDDLAQALNIDRAGLLGTVVRFNGFAAKGRDLDFGRGEAAIDEESGRRRNPSLGKVEKQPFWAVRVYPGDTGTKGGLVVNATSAVLRGDGSVIAGLYACGGAAASIFKRCSPAPGAALAESLVQAFTAVTSQEPDRNREL